MMDDTDSMWLCPDCRSWNGSELPECLECGRQTPRLPVRPSDVDVSDSRRVSRCDRMRVKLSKLL